MLAIVEIVVLIIFGLFLLYLTMFSVPAVATRKNNNFETSHLRRFAVVARTHKQKTKESSAFTFACHIYKQYRDKALGKIFSADIIRPWMKYREIEIIEDLLRNSQPQKCLEWGAGYSTIHFPRIVIGHSKWIAMEHEKDWATRIQNMNEDPNVEIFHVQPNHYPWTDENGDGAPSDLTDYVEFPSKFGKFDFILIDGRARKECLIKAHELLENEGVVVLHDAHRKIYHEQFALYKYQVLFDDYRKRIGGLWIASKGTNISEVLNIQKHMKLWQIYTKIGRVLRA